MAEDKHATALRSLEKAERWAVDVLFLLQHETDSEAYKRTYQALLELKSARDAIMRL